MEVFKIKISPEVLRNELTTQSYSGFSFGYYSGLSYVLSAGTTNIGQRRINNTFLFFAARLAAKLMAVVVLPTPPFWLVIAKILAIINPFG